MALFNMPRCCAGLAILFLMIAVSGCGGGPEIVPARGKVLYQGQPVPNGVVMFQPVSGQPARGDIQPDGTFVLGTNSERDGATVGPNQVRVVSRGAAESAPTDASQGEVGAGKPLVPEKFGSYGTSGLTIEVTRDRTEPYEIVLEDE